MHQSWFTYDIGRNYPYRWFTPVTIFGGIAVATFFSVLNFATSGYNLQVTYTTEPNTTLAEDYWFTKAPWSWTAKMRTTCQPQNVPIGYEFFTTNFGFSYILESVSAYQETTNTTLNYPSLSYLNQKLEDCHVVSVEPYFSRKDNTDNGGNNWWSWGGSGVVKITCTIETGTGLYNATFSTDLAQERPSGYSNAIQIDYMHMSSMWWATRILNLYWYGMIEGILQARYPQDNGTWTSRPAWTRFGMVFNPDKTEDITTYDFFRLTYTLGTEDGTLFNYADWKPLYYYYNNPELAFSAGLTESLVWAKVAYSSVMVDLGQSQNRNILTDEKLLQWTLQHPNDTFRNNPQNTLSKNWNTLKPPGDDLNDDTTTIFMNESYNAFKSQMGPLGTFDASIFTQYACSVPVRKDAGTLFFSILIADLVFLQAAWKILNLIATAIVTNKDKTAMYCEGCDRPYGMLQESSSRELKTVVQSDNQSESTQRLIRRKPVPSATISLLASPS